MAYGIINICLVGSRTIPKSTITKNLAPHVDLISHAYPPPAPDIHPSTNDGIDAWIAGNPYIKGAYYMPFEREIGLYGNRAALHQTFKHPYPFSSQPDQGFFTGDKNNPRDIASRDSWLIFDVDHDVATYNSGVQCVLDTDNDKVVDWQIQTYLKRAAQDGYTNVFLDNLSLDNSFGPTGKNPYASGTRKTTGAIGRYTYADEYSLLSASGVGSLKTGQANYAKDVSLYPARLKRGFTRNNISMKIVSNYNPGGTGFFGPFANNVLAFSDVIYYEEGFLYYGCPFSTRNGNGYSTGSVRDARVTGPVAFAALLKFIQHCRDSQQTEFIMQEMTGRGLLSTDASRLSSSQKIQRDAQVRNAVACYLLAYYPGLYLSMSETASPIDGPGNYGGDYLSGLMASEYTWLAGHYPGGTGTGIGQPKSSDPEQQGDIYVRYFSGGFAAFNSNASKKLVLNVTSPDGVKLLEMAGTIPYSESPNGNIGGNSPNWTIPLAPQNGIVCLYD